MFYPTKGEKGVEMVLTEDLLCADHWDGHLKNQTFLV